MNKEYLKLCKYCGEHVKLSKYAEHHNNHMKENVKRRIDDMIIFHN